MNTAEQDKKKILSDKEILIQNHKFIRDEEEDKQINIHNLTKEQYGQLLAKQYYDKLYKEYALIDLSKYKFGKFGMRWRTKDEVTQGKGDSICGNIECNEKKLLEDYEVNFAYIEKDEKKNILVKVCVCQDCALKLNYKIKHRRVANPYKRKQREEKEQKWRLKDMKKAKNIYKDQIIYLNQKQQLYDAMQKQKEEREQNKQIRDAQVFTSKYEQKYIQKRMEDKQSQNDNSEIFKTN